ncbi:MAG: heavy-metal-associated domain-containing protein [Candidatus Methanofastidiosa archaeon]|nr:heavy-metal-associated domain-containing protein [Candidatus Methanofastidiosa archaeon]
MGDTTLEKIVRFKVEGMGCDGCASNIQKALRSLPGVISASVSFASKKAEVAFDADAVDVNALVTAIDNLGYKMIPE